MPSSTSALFTRLAPLMVMLQLSISVLGHIEMVYPPAINSKWDPQTVEEDKDYSMTSPLNADGSNYPCKGYNTAANFAKLRSVATLTAGSALPVQLAGTATHNGGSCQFAVSYDQGASFAVIASVIGSCPIGLSFNVPIPANLPSAKKATFSWTWFNYSGNREMYQNCAIVDIAGSSATSFTGPSLFRANTFADGTCITTENMNIVFPNPGASVTYLNGEKKGTPATVIENCPFDADTNVTVSPSSSGPAPPTNPKPTQSSAGATSSTTQVQVTPTSRAEATTIPSPSPSPSPATSSRLSVSRAPRRVPIRHPRRLPTVTRAPLVQVTAVGAPAFSAVSNKAAGGQVKAVVTGPITPSPSPSPPPPSAAPTASTSAAGAASVRCDSTSTWSLCGNGRCTFMGYVAAGTVCRDGRIVAERRRVKRQEAGMRMEVHRRGKPVAH